MLRQVSRVHVHFSHPIALHWAASNLPSCVTLQMKSAVTPFWCRLTLLFLSSDRFVHLAEEIELETWTGIGHFFFFPFCMFSHLLLAYLKHFPCRMLTEDSTCSSISGENVRLGSFRDSLGCLSISTPWKIYYSPLQKILHSKHIILPITPGLH